MPTMLARGRYVMVEASLEGQSRILTDAGVVFRDGMILGVGPYEDLRRRYAVDQEVGNGRQFLMPGLVNAHHHGYGVTTFQLGVRDECLEIWRLRGWGRRYVDPYTMTLYTIMQHIRTGTTTVMLKQSLGSTQKLRNDIEATLRAFNESGMRVAYSRNYVNQCFIVNGDDAAFLASLPAELAREAQEIISGLVMDFEEYVSICEELAVRFPPTADGRFRVLVSPEDYHWCDENTLVRLKELAGRLGIGIHTNLEETLYGRLYSERKFKETPARRLYRLGFLGPGVTLAHATWVTQEDIDLVAESGAGICHNASSNLRLGSGIAPVLPILQKGISVGMCTDSLGLNDDEDMFAEMRLIFRLHRPPGINNVPISPDQILHMATLGGARLSTFGDHIGALKPGRRADMVLLDWDRITHPFVDDELHPLEVLLYRADGSDVQTTIIDGRIVYQDGQFLTVDADAVIREVKRQLEGPLPEDVRKRRRLVQQLEPHVRRFYADWALDTRPYYQYQSAR